MSVVRRAIRTRVSWALYWTFSSEDMMGSLAKLGAKTHGATLHKRALERWIVAWWAKITDDEGME